MTLQTRITELAQAVGTDLKALDGRVGVLERHGLPVPQVAKYTISGPLEPVKGTLRWYPDRVATIKAVYFSVGTPGPGVVVLDVLKAGVSIFSEPPQAGVGAFKSSTQQVDVQITPDDYLTVNVIKTGGASDAVLCISYQ